MKPTRLSQLGLIGAFLVLSSLQSMHSEASEAIIVTFKQDLFLATASGKNLPVTDKAAVEAACVATALARNLQIHAGQTGQSVAMFPALAGVKLANERLLLRSKAGAETCYDPDMDTVGYKSPDFRIAVADDYTLLIDLVRQFLAAEGRMVVCPLCWTSRGYPEDDLFEGAEIGTSTTVGPLFLEAQKAIDF